MKEERAQKIPSVSLIQVNISNSFIENPSLKLLALAENPDTDNTGALYETEYA